MIKPERVVLASLMQSQEMFDSLIERGLGKDYFDGVYQKIYIAICEARERYSDDQITDIMLYKKKEIPISKILEVSSVVEEIPSLKGSYLQYFEALEERYLEKQIKKLVGKLEKWDKPSILKLTDDILQLTEGSQPKSDINETVDELIAEINRRHSKDFVNKYRTNLYNYDRLGHFEEGSLLIIAGKSGHGKSTFAINLTNRWLESGLRVVYITYEMTRLAVLGKLSIARSGIEWNKVFKSRDIEITDEEYKHVIEGVKWYQDKPLLIIEGADKPSTIEYYVRKHKADVFIIDTVNFLTSDNAQFWIRLGNLASSYKRIAVKYNTLGVMLAQGSSFTGRPTRKELLAESKKMKDSADYIDFVYREQEENPTSYTPQLENVLEIYRVKGRFTGTGYCYLHFSGAISRIKDLTDWEYEVVREVLHGKR